MIALELYRSLPRYLAARALGDRMPGLLAGPVTPLRLVSRDTPRTPAEGWARVRPRLAGICGSDLATLSGESSFYFSPLVSMPFVPGHEVVGDVLDDLDDLPAGTRVVLDPVLSCDPRGLELCGACARRDTGRCERITSGHLAPGLQIGYCADTGGGWSQTLVAHRSQMYPVPDHMDDRVAVLIEPLACAVHAALRARTEAGDRVVIVGAGTVGIFTLLALRELAAAGHVTVVAKHPAQRDLAMRFGATEVASPKVAVGAIRRSSRALRIDPERGVPFLLGGVDVAIDCAGSRASLDLALRTTRSGGRVVLAALPPRGTDLAPVWFRELDLVGAYATGTEVVAEGPRRTFELAMDLAGQADLDGFVSAVYELASWREAVEHAFSAGRLGTMKVAFDPRKR